MSFTAHPFREITLIDIDDNEVYFWHCSSCGADGQRQKHPIPLTIAEPALSPSILALIQQYHDHVKNSHALTRDDVKDWYT